MIENQSKQVRMHLELGRDMLSELPLGIMHAILARMPIKDAVRTSVLSRQWRYTWTTLPHLVFGDDNSFGDYYKSADGIEDCKEIFITHVLSLHKGPIQSFRLSVPFDKICLSLGLWLLLLARNDIRELVIDMDYYDESAIQELHSGIYSCKKLTKLELFRCELNPPPTSFKAFLFLRCLRLERVDLRDEEFEVLIDNCPLLEEFSVNYCLISELRFSAPNLKVLHIDDYCAKLFVYAPLLAELSVELQNYVSKANDQQQKSSVCNYTDFLDGFSKLEKLCVKGDSSLYLSMGIELCQRTLVFPFLKDMSLLDADSRDLEEVSGVARLILGAPNLEKLELLLQPRLDKTSCGPKVRHVSFSDFGCTPDFKFEKLRVVVNTIHIIGLPPRIQMEFVRFLLERSPVLEKMVFRGVYSEEIQKKLNAQLEGFAKASPNVKLILSKSRKEFS